MSEGEVTPGSSGSLYFPLLFSILLCLAALLQPHSARALQLGDITVSSTAGERFFAVVPITDVRKSDIDNILVTLAPRSVYQRMGVDWEYFHNGLIFDVLSDEQNSVYLRIVSEDVVYEPYLDFVVSVRWPRGYLSEQFTALLPLPAPAQVPVTVRSGSGSGSRTAGSEVPTASASGQVDRSVTSEVKPSTPETGAREAGAREEGLAETSSSPAAVTAPAVVSLPNIAPEPSVVEVLESSVSRRAPDTLEEEEESPVTELTGDVVPVGQDAEMFKADEPASAEAVDSDVIVEEPLEPLQNQVAGQGVAQDVEQVAEKKEPVKEARAEVVQPQEKPAPAIPEVPTDPALQVRVNEPQWAMTSQSGDTLWGLARKIQRQSGGRIVDIVQALFENNQSAFIGNNADRLKISADLNVTFSQIRAATPVSRRAALSTEWQEMASLSELQADAPGAQSDLSGQRGQVEPPVSSDGVLTLVTDQSDALAAEGSPLTESLSDQADDKIASLDSQMEAGRRRADQVEQRMEDLVSKYQALSARTDQLKALEQDLNRSIADKAQLERGLAANLPLQQSELEKLKDEALPVEDNNESPVHLWLQRVIAGVFILGLLAVAYWLSTILKARRFRRHSEWVDRHWDNDIFGEDQRPSDSELSELVKLKGEAAFLSQQESIERGNFNEIQVEEPEEGGVELQASLYIAYERFEDAEKLLKNALEHQPGNLALQSQLLEVYAATGQTEAFEALAAKLSDSSKENLQGKIAALRG